jgi:putative SOS response-associated peptidase YedK
MCNLYSITTNQAAIAALFRLTNIGNLAPMPGVFPDYPAVFNAGADRALAMMRWGMPPPKFGGAPVTNIRQHIIAALARLVEAGESLPCPGQQLLGVRRGAESANEEKGCGVVRPHR